MEKKKIQKFGHRKSNSAVLPLSDRKFNILQDMAISP